jgi:hypothetical protein
MKIIRQMRMYACVWPGGDNMMDVFYLLLNCKDTLLSRRYHDGRLYLVLKLPTCIL